MASRTTPVPPLTPLAPPPGRRPAAHLVGIGGAGMKALAELLAGLGWKVSGSDQRASDVLDRMRSQGLKVFSGHDDSALPAALDVLVHSPAVGPENPERLEAARRGVPQRSLPEMLGALMADRVGVAVTGTHGKSTTTAMVATVLRRAGRSPSAAFGAELCGGGRSGWAGEGPLLVVEGCEYRRGFLSLRPTHAAILNVEPDHFDCYADLAALKATFRDFAASLPAEGVLLARADCAAAVESAAAASAKVVTFSSEPTGDYWAADVRPAEQGTRFRLFRRGDYLAEMTLRVGGAHNVTNALAAAALCHELGVSPGEIREGLWEFRGVRRRFEPAGPWRGRTLIDDYAHHPTAVRAVIEATRRQHPGRRVVCAFQPHQVSRTVALLPDFAAALALADRVLLVPIYAAREAGVGGGPDPVEVAERLAAAVAAAGAPTRLLASLDLLPDAVDHETRPGDVVVTMGAGDIDRVHHEFSRRLRRRHAA